MGRRQSWFRSCQASASARETAAEADRVVRGRADHREQVTGGDVEHYGRSLVVVTECGERRLLGGELDGIQTCEAHS